MSSPSCPRARSWTDRRTCRAGLHQRQGEFKPKLNNNDDTKSRDKINGLVRDAAVPVGTSSRLSSLAWPSTRSSSSVRASHRSSSSARISSRSSNLGLAAAVSEGEQEDLHHTLRCHRHSIPWQRIWCDGCSDSAMCADSTNPMKQGQQQSVLSSNDVEFKTKCDNGSDSK